MNACQTPDLTRLAACYEGLAKVLPSAFLLELEEIGGGSDRRAHVSRSSDPNSNPLKVLPIHFEVQPTVHAQAGRQGDPEYVTKALGVTNTGSAYAYEIAVGAFGNRTRLRQLSPTELLTCIRPHALGVLVTLLGICVESEARAFGGQVVAKVKELHAALIAIETGLSPA